MRPAVYLLREATDLVSGHRNNQHGNPYENHKNIADLWAAYLGIPIRPDQAADMMELLKIARRKLGTFNREDYLDAAGYAAVAYETRLMIEPEQTMSGP